jgi:hypothetical protein
VITAAPPLDVALLAGVWRQTHARHQANAPHDTRLDLAPVTLGTLVDPTTLPRYANVELLVPMDHPPTYRDAITMASHALHQTPLAGRRPRPDTPAPSTGARGLTARVLEAVRAPLDNVRTLPPIDEAMDALMAAATDGP